MQTTPTMQRVITALVERHTPALSLAVPAMSLKLTLPGFMPLVIERLSGRG